MQGEFIIKFIKTVKNSAKEVHDVFQWEHHSRSYKGVSLKKLYYGFRNLKRRGILYETNQGDFRFTTKGKKWYYKSLLRYYKLTNKRWDRQWRIVIFDIPQELHRQRNNFRNKLKNLGFYMLQKSVFVLPYPCEEELGYICQDLGITDYVDIITARTVGFKESEIIQHFNL